MRNKPNGTTYKGGRKGREHTVIAESVLGKKLPPKAEIHHFDGNKRNNCKNNLVICKDREYHLLLHVRAEALAGCGDVNKRFCSVCNNWLDQDSFYLRSYKGRTRTFYACKNCSRKISLEYQRKRRKLLTQRTEYDGFIDRWSDGGTDNPYKENCLSSPHQTPSNRPGD
jgi:hypothetical protein